MGIGDILSGLNNRSVIAHVYRNAKKQHRPLILQKRKKTTPSPNPRPLILLEKFAKIQPYENSETLEQLLVTLRTTGCGRLFPSYFGSNLDIGLQSPDEMNAAQKYGCFHSGRCSTRRCAS